MNAAHLFRLSAVSVVDLVGQDAVKIAQNLTTNDLSGLHPGLGCESFVTDVRGKTVGHFIVFRTAEGLRFVGAAGQSQAFASHVDRYTIREQCQPHVRDEELSGVVFDPVVSSRIDLRFDHPHDGSGYRAASSPFEKVAGVYETPWLGQGTLLVLAEQLGVDAAVAQLVSNASADHRSDAMSDDIGFHERRTEVGFPWFGVDLDETNLPQEADRDREAVCFTKGCYLGQETVARLDALGQVQKKLVRWSLDRVPAVGSSLVDNGKTVGRLTSVAASDAGGGIAIGFARRSHFEPGSTAEGTDEESGSRFIGRVIARQAGV